MARLSSGAIGPFHTQGLWQQPKQVITSVLAAAIASISDFLRISARFVVCASVCYRMASKPLASFSRPCWRCFPQEQTLLRADPIAVVLYVCCAVSLPVAACCCLLAVEQLLAVCRAAATLIDSAYVCWMFAAMKGMLMDAVGSWTISGTSLASNFRKLDCGLCTKFRVVLNRQ